MCYCLLTAKKLDYHEALHSERYIKRRFQRKCQAVRNQCQAGNEIGI